MNTFVNQIILTLKSAWATLLDCDRTVRPIAIQCYAFLSSEAAIKRYRITAEIILRVAEILYLLAIALVNDAQTRINRFVSKSERKETTLPATEKMFPIHEENPWSASPVAMMTDAVTTSEEAIAVPLSRSLALPAAPSAKAAQRSPSRKTTAAKRSPKTSRNVAAGEYPHFQTT
jgi:hypothetical protein